MKKKRNTSIRKCHRLVIVTGRDPVAPAWCRLLRLALCMYVPTLIAAILTLSKHASYFTTTRLLGYRKMQWIPAWKTSRLLDDQHAGGPAACGHSGSYMTTRW